MTPCAWSPTFPIIGDNSRPLKAEKEGDKALNLNIPDGRYRVSCVSNRSYHGFFAALSERIGLG